MKATLVRSLFVGVVGLSFVTSAVNADMIGVDFNLGGSADQSPASTDVVGPVPTSGWTNLENLSSPPTIYHNQFNGSDTGTPVTLVNTAGASTTAKFGFNNFGFTTLNGSSTYSPDHGSVGSADNTLTPNQQLYNGGAVAGGGGYTQQVSLLSVPYAHYDVYLLVAAQIGDPGYGASAPGYGNVTGYTDYDPTTNTATQGATYYFTGTSHTGIPSPGFSYVQATGTSQADSTLNANYVLFSGLTSPNVSFDLTSPGIANNDGAFISGVEIVEAAAVPEPASMGLMLVGGIALLAKRHRAKLA